MNRRKFISLLAGLAAVPAAVKVLFNKQDLSLDKDKICYKILRAKENENGYLYYEIDQAFAESFKHAVWTKDELERIREISN